MAVSAPALQDALAHIVGPERVSAAVTRDQIDGVSPRFVARPASVAQVSELITLAHAEYLAVAPRGSGASLTLGNAPPRLDVIIDLTNLSAIVEYVPADLVATIQAGCSLATLNNTLADHGQMLALDPIGGASRTIGGILATNASGPLRFRYGAGRDMLLGVRFVQADGTITWGGAKVVKSVTGYDVPKLLVGSLGTLGIIVEATLRLHPVPAARATSRMEFRSLESAGNLLRALLDSTLEPERVTLLDGEAARRCGLSADGPVMLVGFGSVREAVESQTAALARLGAPHAIACRAVTESIWDALAPALAAPILVKVGAEPKRLVEWVGALGERAKRLGINASIVAQPASGVLECALWGTVPSARALEQELLNPLRGALASEGGSVVVQQAPIELKRELDVWGDISPETFALMERLKKEFDPGGVLNPGRFVGGL